MFSDHNTSVGLWVYSAPQGWALFSVIAAPAPVWSCDIKQEMSGAIAGLRQGGPSGNHAKLGSHSSSLQAPVSTLLQDYANIHSLLTNGIQASQDLPVSPTGPPVSQGASSPLCQAPGWECPKCSNNFLLSVGFSLSPLSWAPSQGNMSQPDGFSSLPTCFSADLSYSLGCTSLPASFS